MPTVTAEVLHRMYARVATALGADADAAEMFATCFLRADLRGKDTQGIACLPLVFEAYSAGGVDFRASPEVVNEGPSFAVVDCHHAPGQVAATAGMRIAIAKAKETGIGSVWLRHTNDFAMAANYSLQAAEADCIGIAMSNGVPLTAPWGSRESIFNTSPLSFALPSDRHAPLVHDGGLSAVTHGRVVLAARDRRRLAGPYLIDEEGRLTDDPSGLIDDPMDRNSAHAGAIRAISEKVSGLLFLVDAMAGIVSGMTASAYVPRVATRQHPSTMGQWLLAVGLDVIGDAEQIKSDLDDLLDVVKRSRPVAGGDAVRYPGELAAETERARRVAGVPVREHDWRLLLEIVDEATTRT